MLKLISAACLVALLGPGVAFAHDSGSIKHKNKYLRSKVIAIHGKRAPGRNIVEDGLRKGKRPSYRQIRRYFNTMRAMIAPRPAVAMLTASSPRQAPAGTATLRAPAGGTLASIKACESGGGYSTDTGNGFYGAYQFTQSTWQSVGGSGNPAAASPAEQDRRAAILYSQQGSSPWPVCGR